MAYQQAAHSVLQNPLLNPVGPAKKQEWRNRMHADFDPAKPSDKKLETRLLNGYHFETIIQNVRCKTLHCGGHFEVTYMGTGAGGYTYWECTGCGQSFDTKHKKFDDITQPDLSTTYTGLRTDLGYDLQSRLLASQNVQPGSNSNWYKTWQDKVYNNHTLFFQKCQAKTVAEIKKVYTQDLHVAPIMYKNKQCVPVFISADGTYCKRGEHSIFGEMYIVEYYTGAVISCAAVEKCHKCHFSGNTDSQKCPDNSTLYHGSSKSMEGELLKMLYKESPNLGLIYEILIGDCDSSSFDAVKTFYFEEDLPAEEQIIVKKELCSGHVAKCLPAHLKKLKKSSYTLIRTKKGKNKGKNRRLYTFRKKRDGSGFTDKDCNHLGTFYARILKDTSLSIADKQRHIMGIYKHHCDYPDSPKMDLHDDCYGNCPWKLAKLNGEELPRKKGIFSKWQKGDSLDDDEARKQLEDARKLLEDEFRFLSRTELLEHCMLGITQNINESLHSKEHSMASKTKFFSMKRVLFSVQRTALQHNLGYKKGCLLRSLFPMSETYCQVLEREDENRHLIAKRTPGTARSSGVGRTLARVAHVAAEYQPGLRLPV